MKNLVLYSVGLCPKDPVLDNDVLACAPPIVTSSEKEHDRFVAKWPHLREQYHLARLGRLARDEPFS